MTPVTCSRHGDDMWHDPCDMFTTFDSTPVTCWRHVTWLLWRVHDIWHDPCDMFMTCDMTPLTCWRHVDDMWHDMFMWHVHDMWHDACDNSVTRSPTTTLVQLMMSLLVARDENIHKLLQARRKTRLIDLANNCVAQQRIRLWKYCGVRLITVGSKAVDKILKLLPGYRNHQTVSPNFPLSPQRVPVLTLSYVDCSARLVLRR